MIARLSDLWCHLMHGTPMHPVNGTYRCRVCLREFEVRWHD